MRHVLCWIGLLCIAASAQGGDNDLPAQAKAILDKAKEFTLSSLDPDAKAGKGEAVEGWKLLGQTVVKDAEVRKKLLGALEKNLGKKGGAKCFDPRHAIHAKADGKTVDLIICFECGWVHVHVDGKDVAHLEMDSVAQPLFDQVLRDAKVPLPKKN